MATRNIDPSILNRDNLYPSPMMPQPGLSQDGGKTPLGSPREYIGIPGGEIPGYGPPQSELPEYPPISQFEPQPIRPEIKPVDPTQETVAGRMTGLLESESPYMKGARHRGYEYAAKRGLLESTIAGEAGEKAAIEAALPIAQQDAQTYERQRLASQDIGREFAGREQAQQLELGRMGAQEAIARRTMLLEADVNERLYGVQQEYAVELETLRNQFEIQKNLDTAIGSLYADGLKSISNLLDNPAMSAQQREAGLNVIIGNLQSGLNFLAGITGETTGEPTGGSEVPQTSVPSPDNSSSVSGLAPGTVINAPAASGWNLSPGRIGEQRTFRTGPANERHTEYVLEYTPNGWAYIRSRGVFPPAPPESG